MYNRTRVNLFLACIYVRKGIVRNCGMSPLENKYRLAYIIVLQNLRKKTHQDTFSPKVNYSDIFIIQSNLRKAERNLFACLEFDRTNYFSTYVIKTLLYFDQL